MMQILTSRQMAKESDFRKMLDNSREAVKLAQSVINKALGYIHHNYEYNDMFNYINKIRYENRLGSFVLLGLDYQRYLAFVRLYNKASGDSFNVPEFEKLTNIKFDNIVAFGDIDTGVTANVAKQLVNIQNEGTTYYIGINVKAEPTKYTTAIAALRSYIYKLNTQYIIGYYETLHNNSY